MKYKFVTVSRAFSQSTLNFHRLGRPCYRRHDTFMFTKQRNVTKSHRGVDVNTSCSDLCSSSIDRLSFTCICVVKKLNDLSKCVFSNDFLFCI